MTTAEKKEILQPSEMALVLDFDLTCFRTYDFVREYCRYIGEQNHNTALLTNDIIDRMMNTQGQSFDAFNALEEKGIDPKQYVDGFREMCEETGLDFILPDARELMAEAESRNVPVMIMTTGGAVSQWVKLNATGMFETPHRIITDGDLCKAQDLADRWDEDNEAFVVKPDNAPAIAAQTLVLVDDKPKQLRMPEGTKVSPRFVRARYMNPDVVSQKILAEKTPSGAWPVRDHYVLMQLLGWRE